MGNRLSRTVRRFILLYVIFRQAFWGQWVIPGLVWHGGLYGQNLPCKFKKSYGDFQNRNLEKAHSTTGPRSDLIPDSWSWANSGLNTTSRIFGTENFGVATRANSAKAQHHLCYQPSTWTRKPSNSVVPVLVKSTGVQFILVLPQTGKIMKIRTYRVLDSGFTMVWY